MKRKLHPTGRKAATLASVRKVGGIMTKPASLNPGGGVNPGIFRTK